MKSDAREKRWRFGVEATIDLTLPREVVFEQIEAAVPAIAASCEIDPSEASTERLLRSALFSRILRGVTLCRDE